MTRRSLFLTTLLILLSACRGAPSSERSAAGTSQNPFTQHALAAPDRHWLEGEVKERIVAGQYLYLRVQEPSGRSAWLVSLAATTPNSEHVRALVLGRAAHFHSRKLARDFDLLLFAAVRRLDP